MAEHPRVPPLRGTLLLSRRPSPIKYFVEQRLLLLRLGRLVAWGHCLDLRPLSRLLGAAILIRWRHEVGEVDRVRGDLWRVGPVVHDLFRQGLPALVIGLKHAPEDLSLGIEAAF